MKRGTFANDRMVAMFKTNCVGNETVGNQRKTVYLFVSIVLGMITALSLSINFIVADFDTALQITGCASPVPMFFAKLQQNVIGDSLHGTLIAIFCAFFYYNIINKIKKKLIWPVLCVSALFAFINVASLSMYHTGTWDFITKNIYQMMISSACMVGYGILFYLTSLSVFYFLEKKKEYIKPNGREKNRVARCFNMHTVLVSFIVIFLCWLPWILIFYPGSVTWDPAYQAQQVFGVIPYNSHHPLLSTWLIGGCFYLGHMLGNDNLGVFLYVLLQSSICAFVYAKIIDYTKHTGCSLVFQYLSLAFYSLLGTFGSYAQSVIKDTLFCGIFAFYMLLTVEFLHSPVSYIQHKNRIVVYGIVAILLGLLRNNGIFVVMPTILCILFWIKDKKLKKKFGVGLVAILFLYLVLNSAALKLVEGSKGSIGEALSIPLQQTARYVRDHGDEVTAEEKQIINSFLSYDTMAQDYDPQLSDPIKSKCSIHVLPNKKEVLQDYFEIWIQMFLKHPGTYLQATMENTYGYYSFTPKVKYGGWIMDGMQDSFIDEMGLDVHYTFDAPMRQAVKNISLITERVPLLSMLYMPAFYTWSLVILALYFLIQKNNKVLIAMIPFSITLLICIASPVNGMWRYYMPIVAAFPIIISYVIWGSEKERSESCENCGVDSVL